VLSEARLSVDDLQPSAASNGDEGYAFVRHEKDKAASAKFGEEGGTGRRGIKTPGGKVGDRMRMYHPFFGRWIIQQMVDVWL